MVGLKLSVDFWNVKSALTFTNKDLYALSLCQSIKTFEHDINFYWELVSLHFWYVDTFVHT